MIKRFLIWAGYMNPPVVPLRETVEQDALELHRIILNQELEAIALSHKLEAERARQQHLIEWLQRHHG